MIFMAQKMMNLTPLALENHLNQSPGTDNAVTPPDQEGKLTYISKDFIQYVIAKPKKVPPACATGARMLTSEKYSKMILEREEKKQKECEGKEQRKALREQKKKK